MSYIYKCGQFDDSFCPKRLGNWCDNPRPSRVLRTRQGVAFRRQQDAAEPFESKCHEFIADDKGHLLPDVKAMICKKTNHWGYPNVSVWDDIFQCCSNHSKNKACLKKDVVASFDDMPRFYRCRSPLAQCVDPDCTVLDNANLKFILEQQFQELQARCPPVVWVFGYPHKAIEQNRLCVSGRLAKKLGFIYINPERILEVLAMRYLDYCPYRSSRAWYWNEDGKSEGFFNLFTQLPNLLLECPASIQRIVVLLESIVFHEPVEAFNERGILEIIKLLLLTFPCAKGYLIDGFPVTLSEGDSFEREFWPIAAGIYFTSNQWKEAKRRHCNPRLIHPRLFLRSHAYVESLVEVAVKEFGEICIIIRQTECVNDEDFKFLLKVVKDVLIKFHALTHEGEKLAFEPTEDEACRCRQSSSSCRTSTECESECEPIELPVTVEEPIKEEVLPEIEEEEEPEEEEEEEPPPPPSPPPEPEPEPEEEEEPPPLPPSESPTPVKFDKDLEGTILELFPEPRKSIIKKPKVKEFYQTRKELYSHNMPDRTGPEPSYLTGKRRHRVAEVLERKMKFDDENPLGGTLYIRDPAKPEISAPPQGKVLFKKAEIDTNEAQVDEQAYVAKALELEKEKIKKDLADREYRKTLPYTTYRSEPAADPQTIHMLFPPGKKIRKNSESGELEDLKPRKGEKTIRYEDRVREVFHPEEKQVRAEDEAIQESFVPHSGWFDSPEEALKYERAKKSYKVLASKKNSKASKTTLVDKLKGKWTKMRSYMKPVPKANVSAHNKLTEWEKKHPKGWKKGEYAGETHTEFRYD